MPMHDFTTLWKTDGRKRRLLRGCGISEGAKILRTLGSWLILWQWQEPKRSRDDSESLRAG